MCTDLCSRHRGGNCQNLSLLQIEKRRYLPHEYLGTELKSTVVNQACNCFKKYGVRFYFHRYSPFKSLYLCLGDVCVCFVS